MSGPRTPENFEDQYCEDEDDETPLSEFEDVDDPGDENDDPRTDEQP